jgi:C_GCAxxG_C_C family probable redox protein
MTVMSADQAKSEALTRFSDPGPGHINCAQTVVRFALSALGHDPDLMTTARYLGGGVAGMGETCGAITGAALAMGLRDSLLGTEDPELRARTAERLKELVREFTLKFGARRCADLTGYDVSTPEGHKAFVESDAHKRCADYVGWMCDRIAPLLLGPTTAPSNCEGSSR